MTVSADNTAICEYGASQEEVSVAMHKVKEYESIVKKSLKAQKHWYLVNIQLLTLYLGRLRETRRFQ